MSGPLLASGMNSPVPTSYGMGSALATTGAATAVTMRAGRKSFQAFLTGSGAVTSTVLIQGSNDNSSWLTLATISLSGTGSASDGFVSDEAWLYHRANVSAISGTSAAVTIIGGA